MHEMTRLALIEDPDSKFTCACCDRRLNPQTARWAAMSIHGDYYASEEEMPEGIESQGYFSLGPACYARQVRARK